jgi:Cof subfamily protein (haloacid dehalogenase superfamily)
MELIEKLAAIRLVLMDIDGTLISPDHPTFSNVVIQLRKLKPLGIEFSIATGRTIFGAAAVLDALRTVHMNMPPMIAYNGAVVFSSKDASPVRRYAIEKSALSSLVKHCRKKRAIVLGYVCDTSVGPTNAEPLLNKWRPVERVFSETFPTSPEFNGMNVERVTDLLALTEPIVALLVDAKSPERACTLGTELREKFGSHLRITTSGGKYVEVCDVKGTKLDAMKKLASMHKLDVRQVMAIGDNFNDIEMLSAAGVGVAVANAPAPVKNVATMVCDGAASAGVVEALRVLIRSRRSAPRPAAFMRGAR